MSANPRRTRVEIEIDSELLARANRAGTDLSDAAEYGIRRVVGPDDPAELEERRKAWKIENAEAIESSNEYVRKHGLPLAKYRMF